MKRSHVFIIIIALFVSVIFNRYFMNNHSVEIIENTDMIDHTRVSAQKLFDNIFNKVV